MCVTSGKALLTPTGKNKTHYRKFLAKFEANFMKDWPGPWRVASAVPGIPKAWQELTLVRDF